MSDVNQARPYGVTVLPAAGPIPVGGQYWRVVEVRHLTPAENQGRHHIYVDALDAAGFCVRTASIGWDWVGRHPDERATPAPLDKPTSEPAGNIPIEKGQSIRIWIIDGDLPSEAVENLRADHPDEMGPAGERWNSGGHHSFYVRFQRTVAVRTELPATPTEPATGDVATELATLRAAVAELQRWRRDVTAAFVRLEGEL